MRADSPNTSPSRIRDIAALVVTAAMLAACATPEPPKAPPPPPVVAGPGQRLVIVSEANTGAGVTLDSAQELVVRLPIDAAANLEWSLVDLKPGVLTVLGSKFERTLHSANIEEALGSTVWRLKPQAAGVVTLTFDLRRPRSLQPAVQTVTYNVTVK